MKHEYRIYKEVYEDIKSGKKEIEFRLLNEKSEKINVDDYIRFKVLDDEKYLDTKVIDKYIYNDLDELWNSGDVLNNSLNYTKEEFYKVFSDIFGEEKVNESKIVGFKIKVV